MESAQQETEWVEVDCMDCGNLNRVSRRACKSCKRTGKIMKSLPIKRG